MRSGPATATRRPALRSGAAPNRSHVPRNRRPAALPARLFAGAALASCLAPALPAHAQDDAPDAEGAMQGDDAVNLDAIRVAGLRPALSSFPGAVTVLDAAELQDGQRQASLAEPLQRVPGVLALERWNLAQDVQVQSRGFGARSTFGIRGLQLVVDGVPATALDGQGQAASFALGALDRVEVVRGPLALQYGNAPGGAIVGATAPGTTPDWRAQAWAGSNDTTRLALRGDGGTDDDTFAWRAHGAWLRTDGPREHSAADRRQAGLAARWRPAGGHEVRLVADVLAQPDTQDPLGLTRAQWETEPHGTDPAAIAFDTRKRIDNRQGGLHWRTAHARGHESWVAPYVVSREIVQFLSIPPGAQAAPTSSGGVIDLAREETGVSIGHRRRFGDGAFAFGIDAGRLGERRRGFENFRGDTLGVRGALRRDEDNTVRSRAAWASAEWRFAPAWTALGAARATRLDFVSEDAYVAPGNGDDSGRRTFDGQAVSLGFARRLSWGEAFASAGRGFEAPTVVELAYRPDGGTGFNTALREATFDTAEVGLRWRGDAWRGSVTAWRVDGEDDIVPATSSGGRTSFANAGGTRRQGVEASLEAALGADWRLSLVGNWTDATFEDGYSVRVVRGGVADTRVVDAGARVPGIPRVHGFAELAWRARADLELALEAAGNAAIPVDDANTDAAPGHVRLALALRWRSQRMPGWHAFARIDNLADRVAVGSVIVNEANGRAFEPLPGRQFTVGLGWTAARR